MGSWYQDSGGVEKRWKGSRERLQSDDGSTFKGEGGYSGSENEGRWRRPGRREGRGSATKAEAPGEVRRTPNWCEDEVEALAEGAEEIQMEIEARRKREEVVARETEEIAGEESLGCALETFEGKKEPERKRREIREEEEKWEWEREKQMRERLVEAERVKKQGQAALVRKGVDKEGKRGVETSDMGRQDWDQQAAKDRWHWQSRERGIGLMNGG